MAVSVKITKEWHDKYNGVFVGIGCFKGRF